VTRPLRRTTIQQMPPPHPRNRFKYCFEMRDSGGNERAELEAWCLEDPENRRWGNMGYVECQRDEDAVHMITHWGICWRHGSLSRAESAQRREDRRQILSELGYSRVGRDNV